MKKQKHDYDAAQRFIAAFLPEGKLTRGTYQELHQIGELVNALLPRGTIRISTDALFTAFETLQYPIAVEEPWTPGTRGGPYALTNSNRIFIGVDKEGVTKLKNYQQLQLKGRKAYTASGQQLSRTLALFT